MVDFNRKCRVCQISSSQVAFHHGKNLCRQHYNEYMAKWKKDNAVHLKEYRSTPKFKTKRAASVAKAQQKSPEAFLKYLYNTITRPSNKKTRRVNSVCLDVKITYKDLLALYKEQGGHCALMKIDMTHEFNNLRSISVDRIDSSRGYEHGNVQLLCQFAQMGKRHHSNGDCISLLNDFKVQNHGSKTSMGHSPSSS